MLQEQLLSALLCFLSSLAILTISVYLLMKVTRYNDWEEIKKGNIAAAMVLTGNVVGIGIILHKAITTNNTAQETWLWGIVGVILLAVTYVLCEKLAPKLDIDEEIKNANPAVGILMMGIFIAISFISAASIS